MGEDLLLNLLVIPTVNSITVTNIPLYFYRQCSGGTSVFNESKFYDFDKVKKKQFEIINKYDNKDLWFRCHYETVFIYQWACIEYIVHNPNENINKYFDKIKEYSLCEFVVEAKKYFKENQIEDEAVKIFIGDNPEEYYEYLKKINFCKSVKSVMLKKIKRLLSFFEF